jgi:type I restriction enzyme M protein
MIKWKLESDVNDWVKEQLSGLGLKKLVDFNEESAMSDYMKEALKGSAKTKNKTYFGKPDFHIEKYNKGQIPVIIENKLGVSKLISENKKVGIKLDENSINNFAVNGAIHYAQNMVASKKYEEVVAIGIAGSSLDDVQIAVYYVFSATIPPKYMENYKQLNFLQNQKSFDEFYKDATVTEEEKHKILIATRDEILSHANKLNKLMNNHNISTEQRVVYVSGMLLAMQDVVNDKGEIVDEGLTPDDLKGIQTSQKRDSVIIMKHLEEFLDQKKIPTEKMQIMIDSFKMTISLDYDRDKITELDKTVSKLFTEDVSVTKQIFTYLYEYIYKAIDLTRGALDIMAEMYSTFLKYALSDGASLGKVLTPPYITTLMAKILEVNKDSKVMDLATGSAAFLVASMALMIDDANNEFGKNTDAALEKIVRIKNEQLLGIEVDAKMYTLAATNMILRGDGSSLVYKADTFKTSKELYKEFNADILLLNPPFSYVENGMPFFLFGLNNMRKGSKGAVIIQDSAGSGRAIETNKKILAKHKMIASIKMPADLFEPNAGVQTSIYIFEVGTPHNFKKDIVKFIDFRNDGYKRTQRGLYEIDHPVERYNDLFIIYKMGYNALKDEEFHSFLWDLNNVYVEDTISDSGDDWNFEQHQIIDSIPKEEDFLRGVSEYISWEIGQILKEGI